MSSHNVFDMFFGSPILDMIATDFYHSIPAADIIETNNGFIYSIAIPGHEKEDIKVDVQNESLVISIQKNEKPAAQYKRKEFDYSGSTRKFLLHDSADIHSINASYLDGILKIDIDKKNKVAYNKQISIN
jgi:HSP20 family protein